MVIVRIIGGQSEHDGLAQVAEALGEDDIPDPLGAGMQFIAGVIDGGMAVIDLEELLVVDLHELLGGDRPLEVRVIEVREHGHSGPYPLRMDGIKGVLERLDDLRAGRGIEGLIRQDQLLDVRGVHVHVLIRDLLAGDEQEPARLLELGLHLRQGTQPDFLLFALAADDHPFLAEPLEILIQGDGAGLGLMHLQPLIVIGDDVVVRQRQEIITVALIPIGDHLGEIIPVAPIGMRVQVTFIPPRLFGGGQDGTSGEAADGKQTKQGHEG